MNNFVQKNYGKNKKTDTKNTNVLSSRLYNFRKYTKYEE